MKISAIRMAGLAFFLIMTVAFCGCSYLNRYQKDGNITLNCLQEPVKVVRDEKGMPFIYAKNTDDLVTAQGFVTAQDRLFIMEVIKLLVKGRLSELGGDKTRELDIQMRTIGFYRNAKKHAAILQEEDKRLLQSYVNGVNAYIETRKAYHPLEFKLAGIKPELWSIEDSLAIMYYMGWNSAANLTGEIIAQMLIEKLGLEKAQEIFPLNINPDENGIQTDMIITSVQPENIGLARDRSILSYAGDESFHIGSNNWAVAGMFTQSNMPIVANDPHLKSSILPGPWYPSGLITPEGRYVGVMIPGLPGMVIGRTDHFAIGVTNAYGDTQDLYIETVDPENPDHYLEGEQSIPFEIIPETLKIKDSDADSGYREEKITIRLSRRGPVISHVLPGFRTDKVVTMRWSMFESMNPSLGFTSLLKSKTVDDIRESLKEVTTTALNFVFADKNGNVGWQTTGRLPVRSQGEGLIPYPVKDSRDNWERWIPFEEMPSSYNPERGWVGTCNHKTITSQYPYYYSSHLSPSYRYRRMKQLIQAPGRKNVDDHWQFQRDTLNLMAADIAPIMARALHLHDDTQEMGEALSNWDYHDDADRTGPLVFQSVYREFALLVFQDEMGEDLALTMLDTWYFWQERLAQMVIKGNSPWFDKIDTKDKTESLEDLFHEAALKAKEKLSETLGDDLSEWKWGMVHQMEFVSPIRRSGFGKGLLGGGSHPAAGSGETLYRGVYKFSEPYMVLIPASLRMVSDLGDDKKILAVLPGGVSGRLFDPHVKDQVEPYMNGEKRYWWFSDQAIKEHGKSELVLQPVSNP
ncbi:MAG: penicillin acylase family protein [Desulfobacterales bacterium]